MLPRTLEPDVMDSPEEARNYDAMDHSDVNNAFVDDLLAALSDILADKTEADPLAMLDVGTGTARIPVELARREARIRVTAVDLSEQMLAIGRKHLARAALNDRCALRRADCKALPFDEASFAAVFSNSLVHHIPEPAAALGEMLRVLRPGGLLFIRDLARPASPSEANGLVARHAAGESPRQQALLRDSLHASITLGEVRALLADYGLPHEAARRSSDRHWTVCHRSSASHPV